MTGTAPRSPPATTAEEALPPGFPKTQVPLPDGLRVVNAQVANNPVQGANNPVQGSAATVVDYDIVGGVVGDLTSVIGDYKAKLQSSHYTVQNSSSARTGSAAMADLGAQGTRWSIQVTASSRPVAPSLYRPGEVQVSINVSQLGAAPG